MKLNVGLTCDVCMYDVYGVYLLRLLDSPLLRRTGLAADPTSLEETVESDFEQGV